MKTLIKYLKLAGIFLSVVFITSFFLGLLNLIGLSHKISTIFSIIVMVLLFFILGIIEGMNTSKKGFIAGFKIGIFYLILMTVINLVCFQASFGFSRIIYYVVLIFSSVFGSMIGINRKKKN